jgi:hypothetical protein
MEVAWVVLCAHRRSKSFSMLPVDLLHRIVTQAFMHLDHQLVFMLDNNSTSAIKNVEFFNMLQQYAVVAEIPM